MNCSTSCFNAAASADSCSLAAAPSCAVELLLWTTAEIWLMPSDTCDTASDCSLETVEILSIESVTEWMLFTTSCSTSAVCCAISVPVWTACAECSINADVFWAASADLRARVLTSSATTANPLPASPARSASTAAFNDSIFV